MTRIRNMYPGDAAGLACIWLQASLAAHPFISPEYWRDNESLMRDEYLPSSDVYVAESDGLVVGFAALKGSCIAAVFVRPAEQGRGIGRLLLEEVKRKHSELTLTVYQKNEKSISFYLSNGFVIVAESMDDATQEKEFLMKWKRKPEIYL